MESQQWPHQDNDPNAVFPLLPSGLNAGAFYALSTLLTRMVIFHYPVRVFPKLTSPREKEISSVWAGAGEVVWYGVCSRIWREVALGLSPRSGSSQQCESWLLASLSSHSLFSVRTTSSAIVFLYNSKSSGKIREAKLKKGGDKGGKEPPK